MYIQCRVSHPADDGGDSNLPSVLTDNPSIAEQWRTFLLALLFDFSNSSSGSSHSSNGLSLAQATAAAVYLLLQDRVDEAEDLLRRFDLEAAAAALDDEAPLRMQVGGILDHHQWHSLPHLYM